MPIRCRMLLLIKPIAILLLLVLTFKAHADSVFQTKGLSVVETVDESHDEVHQLVRSLSQARGEPSTSHDIGQQILALLDEKKEISEYDYLWTLYSLIIYSGPELEGGMPLNDYLEVSDTAINYLDHNGVGEWVFTDQGQFKMEVYRQAANAAAWALKDEKPEDALSYIELAMNYMREEDRWLQDTQVRVLLNLQKKDEAYTIVKAVLEEMPDFGDFQDFKTNQSYLNWLKAN